MAQRARRRQDLNHPAQPRSSVDLTRMAELLDSCRAHSASIAELAGATSKALSQCYQYEENDPHLGQCCELVQQVLEQTKWALATRGVGSREVEPTAYVEEISKGCERQLQSLSRAMHVVRAMGEILGALHPNHHDHILLALYDMESGIQMLIGGLRKVTQP
jgi:hypothetical protein